MLATAALGVGATNDVAEVPCSGVVDHSTKFSEDSVASEYLAC